MSLSTEFLVSLLGPAPTVEETAKFLKEHKLTTYKRVSSGELQKLAGLGVIKVSVPSLAKYLNRSVEHVPVASHNPNGRKGKKLTA